MLMEIIGFLSGDAKKVLRSLNEQMLEAAKALDFERAADLRDRIHAIESLADKQVVIGTNQAVSDVFAVGRLDDAVLIFALFVRDGKVIGTDKFRMDAASDESDADIMSAFLKQYYEEDAPIPPEILLHTEPADLAEITDWLTSRAGRNIHLHKPQRGDKVQLAALCYRNCIDALEKDAALQKRAWERGEGALLQLSGILGLDSLPHRMECFDNSHIRGHETVSSMVVFTDGQPDRKAYRRFRIRAETGGDDLIAMREVLTRRFERAKNEDAGFAELPDLLIIDGGQTQLAAALDILDRFGLSFIPAIGLAESHELIWQPDADTPIELPKASAALHLLERIRDEAHRFAITYHRSLRQKTALFSILDEIDGIGDKRKRALFDAFTTLDAIREADIDALSAVAGMTKTSAEAVWKHFHADTDEEKE